MEFGNFVSLSALLLSTQEYSRYRLTCWQTARGPAAHLPRVHARHDNQWPHAGAGGAVGGAGGWLDGGHADAGGILRLGRLGKRHRAREARIRPRRSCCTGGRLQPSGRSCACNQLNPRAHTARDNCCVHLTSVLCQPQAGERSGVAAHLDSVMRLIDSAQKTLPEKLRARQESLPPPGRCCVQHCTLFVGYVQMP